MAVPQSGMESTTASRDSRFKVEQDATGRLCLVLEGDWRIGDITPDADTIIQALHDKPGHNALEFNTTNVTAWDSALLTMLRKLLASCEKQGMKVDQTGLPDGVRRLLALAASVPEKRDAGRQNEHQTFIYRLGKQTEQVAATVLEMVSFIGKSCLSLLRMVTGQARFRRRDLWLTIQECGANALPIVSLISFLVGLILAFVGAIQLQRFGAQIYVADLVAIAMAREMGSMMTAIVMAGRTGAAFAAQLGTMTVNEEIDAFRTLGFSPMDFLVLPRMLALALMMPLLALYSNLLGILGGVFVAATMLDITSTQYINQTRVALSMSDVYVGLTKAVVFGVLVAMAGCLRGMQCGRSSAAVGLAATSAVVTSIVLIIVVDAIFAVVTNVLGI